jgi:hypothetical protein
MYNVMMYDVMMYDMMMMWYDDVWWWWWCMMWWCMIWWCMMWYDDVWCDMMMYDMIWCLRMWWYNMLYDMMIMWWMKCSSIHNSYIRRNGCLHSQSIYYSHYLIDTSGRGWSDRARAFDQRHYGHGLKDRYVRLHRIIIRSSYLYQIKSHILSIIYTRQRIYHHHHHQIISIIIIDFIVIIIFNCIIIRSS